MNVGASSAICTALLVRIGLDVFYYYRGSQDTCSAPVISSEESLSLPNFWEENKNLIEVDASMSKYSGRGGTYTPPDCQPLSKIAIIIPYRDRSNHLAHLLEIMHPFLQRQRLQYTIVVVNQTGEDPFLRGLLLNAGVLESLAHLPYRPDCFILHDVDHIPERLSLVYQCSQSAVLQLSNCVDRFDFAPILPRNEGGLGLGGGVTAITKGQFESINGYSNLYIGWGMEDNDFTTRIRIQGLVVDALPDAVSRYHTMDHERELIHTRVVDNFKLNQVMEGSEKQGLNNVRDYYALAGVEYHNSFTEFKIKPHFSLVDKDASLAIDHLKDFDVEFKDGAEGTENIVFD